ncbi:hypothetical protein E2320_002210 [Naja naja]|nr:hypothetical protein E2320_002210 [Naja naja]
MAARLPEILGQLVGRPCYLCSWRGILNKGHCILLSLNNMEEAKAVCSHSQVGPEDTPGDAKSPIRISSAPKLAARGAAAKLKEKAVASRKTSTAEEKDSKRRHKALEKLITKGQKDRERQSQTSPHSMEAGFSHQNVAQQLEASQVAGPSSQTLSPDGAGEEDFLASQDNRKTYSSSLATVLPVTGD